LKLFSDLTSGKSWNFPYINICGHRIGDSWAQQYGIELAYVDRSLIPKILA